MPVYPTLPNSAWQLQDAKAQFSALVDSALRGVPQHITRRGKQAVVVLSEADFSALQRQANTAQPAPSNLVAHLLAMPKELADTDHSNALEAQPRDIDFS